MKKAGIILVAILISVSCNTTDGQSSSPASTPTTIVASKIPVPTMTRTPIASPTANLPTATTTLPSTKASYQIGIALDPALQSGDISIASAWLGYAAARSEWTKTNVSAEEIVQNGYHRAFEEEVSARSSLAEIWKELSSSQVGLENPYLDDLLRVYDANFIREYTWVYLASNEWSQPEGLRLNEFSTWASKNLSSHKPETLADIEITIEK